MADITYEEIYSDNLIEVVIYSDGDIDVEYDDGENHYQTTIGEDAARKLYEKLKEHYEGE